MSNLYVNSIQPFSAGPLSITSASLLGLSSATTPQILYYNTSSGVVTFGADGGVVNTGSFYISSSVSNATITFNQGDGTTEAVTVNNVQNTTTASFATNFTASNILITGLATVASASISYLEVVYETASVIYSTGSNQFGDAVDDVQSLYGTVNIVTGSLKITGSAYGNVTALSIASSTASLDLTRGNFYTLTLVSGSTTFINPSNISPGQTINLRITQPSVSFGTIAFPSSVKQVSGSSYTPTAVANAQDIVTFISFDGTNLYLSNVKNLI